MAGQKQLHSLQFSWFIGSEVASSDLDSKFRDIFGQEYDQFQRLKPPASPVPLTVASAVIGDADLRLQVGPGRADILIAPLSQEPTSDVPAFGNLNHALKEFIDVARRACGAFGLAYRQSMITRVGTKFPNIEEATKQFSKVLGIKFDLSATSDQSFQINRRTEINGFSLNRVLRWLIELKETRVIAFNPGVGGAPAEELVGESIYLSYVLDINTVPNPMVFRDGRVQVDILNAIFQATEAALAFQTIGEFK
ncbi:hypothetical protein [Mesorhizobium sp. WSM3876]|uniref:hypothetical protein n=1 Tax=Mesorhizobium sp. WSM3876 TaxID=422277 RepID=UPI000BAEDE90|nr:hypothetical protein [Mesorhizobium sp. WSM3876]PBB85738.1 hypothetical protein CK216_16560 [Mesorhizobium sp. WSM3876]